MNQLHLGEHLKWAFHAGKWVRRSSTLSLRRGSASNVGDGRMPGWLSIEQSRKPILPVGMFFEMLVYFTGLYPHVLS